MIFFRSLLSQALNHIANLLPETLPYFLMAIALSCLGKQVLDGKCHSRLGAAKEPMSANKSFVSNLMMRLTPRVLPVAVALSSLYSRLLGAR